ncbi:glycosyl hydrolase family 18 protein [Burkholderia ubonensis]|uniref:glycosyl hydrolase family 18 protein n=1 Tax=Burkholderia ubonensis TaxID=101571 RepID=UPI001C52F843|nr:glycosyl hydrolase family 18 protein [Burkholderia ubonensis]
MKRLATCIAGLLSAASISASAAPMVLAYYSGYSHNYDSLTRYYGNFNAVSVDFYNITKDGTVTGTGDPAPTNALAFLKSKGIPAYGCVSNVDGNWSASLAHEVTSTHLDTAVRNLVAFAQKNRFAGINIDFEEIDQGDRNNFSNFVQVLGRALHAQGLKLIVSVPAFSTADETHPANYGYDLRALGAGADYLQIMTYDEAIPSWDPGPVAGSDWMENDLDYAVSLVSADKILNGLPSYGYDWRADNSGTQLFWADTDALVKQYGVTPRYVGSNNSMTFRYTANDGSGTHTVWTENARSVQLKASLVNAYGLGGTSMYALGMENARFWQALKAGLAQQ